MFSLSDLSSENVSEEESFVWYCGKCYKEISPGHLKVNYDNWIECDICKQWYHTICENFDPDIDELCSHRVIHLMKALMKMIHLYGIAESVMRKHHQHI